jgi:hypothetical protein
MRYEIEPCYITSYSTSGIGDSFDFQSKATGETSGGDDIIRLPDDVIIDASDLFVDPSNPNVDLSSTLFDDGHTADMIVGMGDGSVRSLNPFVTVDYF